ncbi:SAM-dependent methyltransferase [Nocardiopsis gilva YIM 90087]|uniref:SAM-dependent methyltransferase n=1 Tax=Nocardiopsis gilva YIM 90087 TaxID=1235441 RepID=A0A223S734_9ACTN|nr:methyltransferase domain-containing protein [Nocardiopsis gilva]ASU83916.1 SAM-dependent methyltransferase [Nocardiopsis gilva YIM 90087]
MASVDGVVPPERFPRSSGYDLAWQKRYMMGPNPLWLTEWLAEDLPIGEGARVLDLGAGTALTSVFLAREFGARVTAADLWVDPGDNWRRVREAGVADRVLPLRAEARDLPFAEGYFDAVVSIDAYHYFGTDDLYLDYLLRFIAPGGRLGIVSPGLARPVDGTVPERIRPYWQAAYRSFHSAQWWRATFESSQAVRVERADTLVDGWKYWLAWNEACTPPEDAADIVAQESAMLRADAGETLGFVRVIARNGAA